MIYLLDACAMIALLHAEPGEEVVWSALCDSSAVCLAHSINLCEVYYNFHRLGGEAAAKEAIADLKYLGVAERNDFDEAFWLEAGNLKAVYKKVSLADCCAIALTNCVGGELLTSDHHELDPLAALGVCPIIFIR